MNHEPDALWQDAPDKRPHDGTPVTVFGHPVVEIPDWPEWMP